MDDLFSCSVDVREVEDKIFERVNDARMQEGLPPLQREESIDLIAREHSVDMASRDVVDHLGFAPRADRVGTYYVGENCAMGNSVRSIVSQWLDSPGHKENIMDERFTKTGVGVADRRGSLYATQIFGD